MANDIHCVWVYLIYPQGAPWFSFSSRSLGRWLLLALWNNSFVIFLLRCVLGDGLIAKLCPTLATSLTVAFQAPLSMGFSRQEYWSGLSFPLPGDLPHPGIEPASRATPALKAYSLPLSHIQCSLRRNIHLAKFSHIEHKLENEICHWKMYIDTTYK